MTGVINVVDGQNTKRKDSITRLNTPSSPATDLILSNAKPYPYQFKVATTALIIIDMQRDFLLPGGFASSLGNDVTQLKRVVQPLRMMLAAARAAGLFVIHTREGHRPDLSDLPAAKKRRGNAKLQIGDKGPMGRIMVRGEYGHDIIDELKPLPMEPIIDKPGKGSFYATDLDTLLKTRHIESLIITGVTTEVCVHTTAREANDRGYEVLLLEDCVGSYFPEFQEFALKMMVAQGGIFGWVTNSTEVISTLGYRREPTSWIADLKKAMDCTSPNSVMCATA
eukprot:CAMPEP_0184655126 /NCGR_PEP_ID=MMETSP0308-20130426/12744_1 /TAXON_ID=38269 /ORGANISM="Gloeochaete witrockiana, Strain SAG 46.84" /LENGTH=280 /DNA_ID=CAMNT_0027091405 /DNA_START=193 /DNA_END=1035 /DNA_ORIENTATION=-